jgi:hypothetical protein
MVQKKKKQSEYDKEVMRTGVVVMSILGSVVLLLGLLIGKLIWG